MRIESATLKPMEDGTGLRERKKAATRTAITAAAVKLALQEGPDNVRVTEIASEADVSPRTYNNYFSSIPEAICAGAADRAMLIGDALRQRPGNEPLAKAVAAAVTVADPSNGAGKEIVRLIVTTPSLRGEFFKVVIARENALADAIAERVGSPPGDFSPRLLAAAYLSATRVATHIWLHDDNADYAALINRAFELIAPMATAYEAERKTGKNAA
jgi:AcrR family transcriptional regulator